MTPRNGAGLVFAAALFLQGVSAQPVRLGPTADRVTAADIAQIAALPPQPGSRPWVLVSFGTGLLPSMPWFIDVFLEPDRQTPSVRRGGMMTVRTTTPAQQAYEGARVWQVVRMAEYGQVPSRSDATRVRDGRDLNRPFRIHGVFTDDEVAGLVTFIRTSPPDPSFKGVPGAMGSHVEGTWPIALLLRDTDEGIAVSLLDDKPDEKQGQRVWLRHDGTRWVVVRVNYWIAD
jgi:hypothetical protein